MSLDSSASGGGPDSLPRISSVWGRLLYLFGVVSLRALVGVVLWVVLVAVVIDPPDGLLVYPTRLLEQPGRLFNSQTGIVTMSVFVAYWFAVWVYVPVKSALSSFYARVRLVLSMWTENSGPEDDGEL